MNHSLGAGVAGQRLRSGSSDLPPTLAAAVSAAVGAARLGEIVIHGRLRRHLHLSHYRLWSCLLNKCWLCFHFFWRSHNLDLWHRSGPVAGFLDISNRFQLWPGGIIMKQ